MKVKSAMSLTTSIQNAADFKQVQDSQIHLFDLHSKLALTKGPAQGKS